MNGIQSKAIITGIWFVLIFLSGFWLSRSGKPYPVLVLALHKLITVGTIIYLAINLARANSSTPLGGRPVAALTLTVACFLIMLATGGLLSVDKAMPAIANRIHQILPYLTVVSAGITVYLTLFARALT